MTAVTLGRRIGLLLLTLAILLSCALEDKPIVKPIGDFRLGHVTVNAREAETTEWGRPATEMQLTDAVRKAVRDRFGPLRGRSWYHLGITLDAYLLPPPGVPIVASPRAILVAQVQVWDDRTQSILNPRAESFAVRESTNAETLVGSGYNYDAAAQLERVSKSLALQIERWLRSEDSPLPDRKVEHQPVVSDEPSDEDVSDDDL